MQLLESLLSVFYPKSCVCCGKNLIENESVICLKCRANLPVTNFCFEVNNLVEKAFYGRIPLISATALLFYAKKGKTQTLIHQLKYRNQQEIGCFIGNWLAENMIESKRFTDITCIVPVPLHISKMRKRGYNQLTTFGQTLAKKLQIPFVENTLIRTAKNSTQTKKHRLDRWQNVSELFSVIHSKKLEKQHILLIDDVITTGATLEACYKALSVIRNIKISIACMAYTK